MILRTFHSTEILDYIEKVPMEEIAFVGEAYWVNMQLFEEGLIVNDNNIFT